MPGRDGADTLLAEHLKAAARVRQGRLQALFRPQTGLRCLSAEASMHAQPTNPEALPVQA